MKIDDRTKLLLGDKFSNLEKFKVAVIGVGGVGSIIPISFVRSGIKNIIIIDKDKVDESNLNRQIAYTKNDIGKNKVECLKNLLYTIRDDVKVEAYPALINDAFDFSLLDGVDYIIDCIDDIKAKVLLAKKATEKGIKIVVSLGMGNKLNPELVKITKLNKTTNDPLAKKYRYLLKQEGIDLSLIDVAFSLEKPIIKEKIISSIFFVPNAAGIILASYVFRQLLEEK